MTIRDYLGKSILFFDGGTGSVLQGKGLKPGELPENWNIIKPEEITALHYSYYLSGANIIKTNTFGAFSTKFTGSDNTYSLKQIIDAAFANAEEARRQIKEKEAEDSSVKAVPRFIAFDMGSCGKLLKPLGDLDFEDAVTLFKDSMRLGAEHNPDAILIETINDVYEAKAAVLAAKEVLEEQNKSIPIFVTTAYDEGAKSLTGSTPQIMTAVLESLGVDAFGLNCSLGPVQMKPIVSELLECASIPLIVNPNAGLPRTENGKMVYDIDADEFAEIVSQFCKEGVFVAGGCCGTNPSYIRKLVTAVESLNIEPTPVKAKKQSVITSGTKLVQFGRSPVLIGERINPTGKKKFKQALRDNDIPYILNEGIVQEEKGAQVLDVNVGLPEIDECAMMQTVIKELQAVTDLPLQIDTSDPVTMEKALRIYNGKPLINSVNGKQEVMNAVFPLVKKYGGIVVALTIDEDGIPETAEGRIRIAENIYKTASSYGIGIESIIIDPLAMAVSSDDKAALATLQTVRYIKEKYNGNTILGVSNISFGLPLREQITSIFFTMAMQNGLSAAIMNPNSQEMMKAWTCFNTLSGYDAQCMSYISFAEKYAALQPAATAQAPSSATVQTQGAEQDTVDPLIKAITKGFKDNAEKETKHLLSNADGTPAVTPMEIINQKIIPALDIVGKAFEEKKAYLPQLLMAAEAAKSAFTVIKDVLNKSGKKEESKGEVVLATVKGDIHDIGKNIVKVLLENYGFLVVDLGKDVAPEAILEAVLQKHIELVGLSALMTTTVPSMAETIKLLRKDAPWCRVCVGGAVLTKEYADMIGADRYTKDAMDTVKYAQEIFTK